MCILTNILLSYSVNTRNIGGIHRREMGDSLVHVAPRQALKGRFEHNATCTELVVFKRSTEVGIIIESILENYYKCNEELKGGDCPHETKYMPTSENKTMSDEQHFVFLLSQYKNRIREQIGKAIVLADLKELYQAIDANFEIRFRDFIHELNSMKVDFIGNIGEIDFISLYDGLLYRLDTFGKRRGDSTRLADQEIMSTFYTAVEAKAAALRRGCNTTPVYDFVQYLDIVIHNIQNLDMIAQAEVFNKYLEQYRSESRVDEVCWFIPRVVYPSIPERIENIIQLIQLLKLNLGKNHTKIIYKYQKRDEDITYGHRFGINLFL